MHFASFLIISLLAIVLPNLSMAALIPASPNDGWMTDGGWINTSCYAKGAPIPIKDIAALAEKLGTEESGKMIPLHQNSVVDFENGQLKLCVHNHHPIMKTELPRREIARILGLIQEACCPEGKGPHCYGGEFQGRAGKSGLQFIVQTKHFGDECLPGLAEYYTYVPG
ncbi:MAG: hypothetical protein Q9171_002409 [Xanthocarpia ochracea]